MSYDKARAAFEDAIEIYTRKNMNDPLMRDLLAGLLNLTEAIQFDIQRLQASQSKRIEPDQRKR